MQAESRALLPGNVEAFPEDARKSWQVNRRCEIALHENKLCVTCRHNGRDKCFFTTEDAVAAAHVCRLWLGGSSYEDIRSVLKTP